MLWRIIGVLFIAMLSVQADESFHTLKVKGDVYTNVTVTTVTATDIYFTHAHGMASAKLKDLAPDLQKHFHYDASKGDKIAKAEAQATADYDKRMAQPTLRNSRPGILKTTVARSAESLEMAAITNQALALLEAKDYEGLDTLAQKLRDSKEEFSSGTWKVSLVYTGLGLSEQAPESEWNSHLAAVQEWVNARSNSITAYVALANELTTYAWKARGNGWAQDVTPEGWRLFALRLNQAVQILIRAKSLDEKCPYWWSALLKTELGLNATRAQHDSTLNKAIEAWPGYCGFYNLRAKYLLPRWSGQQGEWESDLEDSASKLGGEEGDLLYARVAAYMNQQRFFTNMFQESAVSWPRVDKGFQIMEKRFTNSSYPLSEHACLAVLARDKRVASMCFDQLGGQIDLTVWLSVDTFSRFATWAGSIPSQGQRPN